MGYEEAVEQMVTLFEICASNANASKKCFLFHKLQHSFDIVTVGSCIHKWITDDIKLALLLHDIGFFISRDNNEHARLGYDFLTEVGITDATILLPVLYHENDRDWKELLKKNPDYVMLDASGKKTVKNICKLVRDADIISNMRMALYDYGYAEWKFTNKYLLDCLETRELPDNKNNQSISDNIVYLFCGLSLVNYPESFEFIKRHDLISDLFTVLKNHGNMSPVDLKRILAVLNENYDI